MLSSRRHRLGLAGVLTLAGITLVVVAALAAETGSFHVVKRIAIGGEGGWDCIAVESAGHRLFVSHGTRVEVVDLVRDSVVGHVLDTPGVHDIAFAPELGRGYTSNGRDSSVSVFDLATLAPLARIKVPGRNPDVILYDEASKRVFTFNGGSANATAIDAAAGTVVGNVELGGRPEFAVTDGAGRMFVNLEDSSAVVTVDTRTLKVTNRWPLAPGEGPSGLAIDRARGRLFSACSNEKCVVIDTKTGKVIATLPIGKGVDGIACDAKRGLVFSSNGADSSITVIAEDAKGCWVQANVPTERGARTIALDEGTGTVYTVTADFGPPPAPTAERPRPRPSIVPGSFHVLVVRR